MATAVAQSTFSFGGGFGYLGSINFLTWFPKALGSSMAGGLVSGHILELLFLGPVAGLMAHSRALEWEADRFGHQIALGSGAEQIQIYSGWGEFLNFMQQYLSIPKGFFTKIFSDHPDGNERKDAIQERFGKFAGSMVPYGRINHIGEDFEKTYVKIHTNYQTGVHQWGKKIKEKREGKNERRPNDYLVKSLFSPGHQCVQHALGGIR